MTNIRITSSLAKFAAVRVKQAEEGQPKNDSRPGLLGAVSGGTLGYGIGKGIDNFDLFNPANRRDRVNSFGELVPDTSIAGMGPYSQRDFVSRVLFDKPSWQPTIDSTKGIALGVYPTGSRSSLELERPPTARPISTQELSTLILHAMNERGGIEKMPAGGRLIAGLNPTSNPISPTSVEKPVTFRTRLPLENKINIPEVYRVAQIPSTVAPMFHERWPVIGNTPLGEFLGRRVGFPTAAGFREGFMPGGVHSAGMRGKLPFVTAGIGAMMPFLPHLFSQFSNQPAANSSPQTQADNSTLAVPPELLGNTPQARTVNTR